MECPKKCNKFLSFNSPVGITISDLYNKDLDKVIAIVRSKYKIKYYEKVHSSENE